MNKKETTKDVVIIINGSVIWVSPDGKLVPILPITNALNIDYYTLSTIMIDSELWFENIKLSTVTTPDGESMETYCLKFDLIFGWLFSIKNESNWKDIKSIYDAFWSYFNKRTMDAIAEIQTISEIVDEDYEIQEKMFDEFINN